MLDATKRRRNAAPWWGLLFAIGGIACNAAFFVRPPLQALLPWLSLGFALLALIFLVTGLARAFGQPQVYGGKTLSVVLTVIALLPIGLTAFVSIVSRKLPDSSAAPQIGQRVADFTLSDTSGKIVSLDQLLARPSGPQAPHPKAVLLIFYRGYW